MILKSNWILKHKYLCWCVQCEVIQKGINLHELFTLISSVLCLCFRHRCGIKHHILAFINILKFRINFHPLARYENIRKFSRSQL